ncbi:MAG TPA: 16S rRNA (uracil(1498)-N(3))-methyltransferase [candidate division Zixibacteria bacterium]|nr:16S rRNA (uracil(1498)-N(3))-methyltransferase [candidate division Zixibacteria bacterium]HEQ98088.1 16S rRNA (uracil(1498)-N(3))-methyltransferase [candidate division Zixibacteria bacterium]
MNLIILTDKDRTDGGSYLLEDHRAEHIRSILQLSEGDSIEIGILNAGQGRGRITTIDSKQVCIRAEKLEKRDYSALSPHIDLICALPRPQTLKKILLICGMMAVRKLYLIRASRVEKSYYHSPLLNPDNYNSFLIEGLSQGKHTRLPSVEIHERFKPFFEEILPSIEKDEEHTVLRIFPDPESNRTIKAFYDGNARRILLAIGPEGGWVPFEIEMMQEHGFEKCTLGRWILRVEHAVTAALSQIEMIRLEKK